MTDDPTPDLTPPPPGGRAPDLGGLFQQAQDMIAAREEAEDTVVEGSSGGGMVRVAVTGGLEFRSVTIDPSVVDADEVDILEDLVLAAVRDAVNQAMALTEEALGRVDLGGLGLDDLDLGQLGKLFE